MSGRLARFFKLSAAQSEQALAATAQHAKQPSQPFVVDGEHKRREASALLQARIEDCARAPYAALERLRALTISPTDPPSP